MEAFEQLVSTVDGWVWGPPLLILLVGTGTWLTLSLRFIQFSKMWHALYLALVKRKEEGDEEGDITHFQALMTALSATVSVKAACSVFPSYIKLPEPKRVPI